jgi:DNA-binding beta-propeller fold protein YncE
MIQQAAMPSALRVVLIFLLALLVSSDIIKTFAGDYYLGDGGTPTHANLYTPKGVAFDSVNNLVYIADTTNHIIRVINRTSNTISTVAGIHSYPGTIGAGKI